MIGLGFQTTVEKNHQTKKKTKKRRPSSSRSSAREDDLDVNSPDSVIFNLFSSASGSAVGRCSSASDAPDNLLSNLPDIPSGFPFFSSECQTRRSRSNATGRKHRRRRPASLDLSEQGSSTAGDAAAAAPVVVVSSSPRLVSAGVLAMKRASVPSRRSSGTFPSPGTPAGLQKGWNSERVPLPNRRCGNSGGAVSGVLPFGNGRALPSKWEDAEKWIFSPVSGDNVGRAAALLPPQQRRPKSKSGPLGGGFEGGRVRGTLMGIGGSPFSAGVLIPDRAGHRVGGGGGVDRVEGRSSSAETEPCMVRSASVHGWSDLLVPSSLPSSQDEKAEGTKDASTMISPPVLSKDMATQMSPEGSSQSSLTERPQISSPSRSNDHPIANSQSHLSKLEVRDVQVDDRVTVTRWSKKQISRVSVKGGSANIMEWKKKTAEVRTSAWEVAETAKTHAE
ncbi:hypothetical protein QJS10_CPB19g01774 [Acorus calamus]|uniref:Remorin C-terminal domain-containing protein n=1 Tax=Acorus calamus TaxID=4465 RepID=A0AAV9CLB1_ACOCL|nr:hypothetical protein QJS10_CPB19g01774 [Acorus calamus]